MISDSCSHSPSRESEPATVSSSVSKVISHLEEKHEYVSGEMSLNAAGYLVNEGIAEKQSDLAVFSLYSVSHNLFAFF